MSELPEGVREVKENGLTLYQYKVTGFKTLHLNRMLRHIAKRPAPAKKAAPAKAKDGK